MAQARKRWSPTALNERSEPSPEEDLTFDELARRQA
jgi:hypothetical protein